MDPHALSVEGAPHAVGGVENREELVVGAVEDGARVGAVDRAPPNRAGGQVGPGRHADFLHYVFENRERIFAQRPRLSSSVEGVAVGAGGAGFSASGVSGVAGAVAGGTDAARSPGAIDVRQARISSSSLAKS